MHRGICRKDLIFDYPVLAIVGMLATLLGGCGGGGGGDSSAQPESLFAEIEAIHLDEDASYSGTLTISNSSSPATYRITSQPAHGVVLLTAATGAFTYLPSPDYFGADSFTFLATDTTGASVSTAVPVKVADVDDPPQVAPLSDAGNSPETYEVVVPVSVMDPDGDELSIAASADDPTVVGVVIDNAARQLVLRPRSYGASRVRVQVNDGTTTVTTAFTFTVADVARAMQVRTTMPSSHAIVLRNTSSEKTDFELTHNGRHAFTSIPQILNVIRNQPAEVADEPFERKLWRYIRDNTFHEAPVNTDAWMNAPWAVLNSFGWGFCSHVAAVFQILAKAAGYQSRIWALNGHVVPEVLADGAWKMYDPDLAVYYYKRNGVIANVTDLMDDPSLITAPNNRIFDLGMNDSAFGGYVSAIYGTREDNDLANYASTDTFPGSRIALPSGASLIYPGQWTEQPMGLDGTTATAIMQFRQARLEVPPGYLGSIQAPWVPWDIQGNGSVRIGGKDFEAGSTALRTFLSRPGFAVSSIEITDNPAGLALIMMINPLWYDMLTINDVIVTGKDVWAISAEKRVLPQENQPPPPVPDSLRKPRA